MKQRSRLVVSLVSLVLAAGCSRKAPQETLPDERAASPESRPPGTPHAGTPDAGTPDAGTPEPEEESSIGPAIGGVRIGGTAPLPDLKMLSVDGKHVSLADVRGKKGLLVVFTCNACPYVRAWEERIVTLGNEYIGHGVGVIAVNANDPGRVPEDGFEAMKTRAKERGMKYPYAVDGMSDLARAFGATRTPEAFLFGADGKLAYHGTIDDNAQAPNQVTEQYLKNALAAVVSGQPVPVPETKSMGCSIKFRS